jgi:hypothetical protein
MKKRDAIAVLGETGDPVTHFVAIERRIEVNDAFSRPRTL